MPEYPYVDLDLLRTYALKIDHTVYYIEHNRMECRFLDNWAKDRPAITWDEFVEMSSPQEDFSEQLAALLGI